MLSKTLSGAVIGIEGVAIEVEVNATGLGEPTMVAIVGLPDAAVRESRDRVRSALQSTGLPHPKGQTIVNLAPADLKKEGAAFDLAIAVGMLGANRQIKRDRLSRTVLLGELALDGSLRPVRGALPIAAKIAATGEADALLLPEGNAAEAALGAGEKLAVYPIRHLADAVAFFNESRGVAYRPGTESATIAADPYAPDFADVKGQTFAKRAMEIAAAGGHNSLLVGPPGTGKSMIASRVPSILPPFTREENLASSCIYSVLGLLNGSALLSARPFRAPHHTISDVALIGGGKEPRPGEISLAHG